MQDANLKLDEVSLVTILAASGRLGCLLNGKEIQALKLLREAQVEGMEVRRCNDDRKHLAGLQWIEVLVPCKRSSWLCFEAMFIWSYAAEYDS